METLKGSSTDVENTNNLEFSKNTELIKQEEIAGTPFRRVTTEEGEFISLGIKRLTELESKEQIDEKIEELQKINWKFMLSVMSVLTQETVAQLHLDMMKFEEDMIGKEEIPNG